MLQPKIAQMVSNMYVKMGQECGGGGGGGGGGCCKWGCHDKGSTIATAGSIHIACSCEDIACSQNFLQAGADGEMLIMSFTA